MELLSEPKERKGSVIQRKEQSSRERGEARKERSGDEIPFIEERAMFLFLEGATSQPSLDLGGSKGRSAHSSNFPRSTPVSRVASA